MRRAKRFRRLAKWIALTFCAIVLSTIALSSRYQVDYLAGRLGVSLSPAAVSIDVVEAPFVNDFYIRRTDPNLSIWWWRWPGVWLDYVLGLGVEFALSLWLLLAASIVVTLLLWHRDRMKNTPGACTKCGYNLTGNTSGVCPECGTARVP